MQLYRLIEKIPYGYKIVRYIENRENKYSEHNLALGFAIGIFFAFMPTFGSAIIFAIIISSLLNASKFASILGILTSNPLTSEFMYNLGFKLGNSLSGTNYSITIIETSIRTLTLSPIILKILIGNIIVATIFSIIAYTISYKFFGYIIKLLILKHK